jgi:hypothetical protein
MKLSRNEQGGIVLEAALIMPIFLTFILTLILLIQISLIELILQSRVSETVKMISTQMYPVQLLVDKMKNKIENSSYASFFEEAMKQLSTPQIGMNNNDKWNETFSSMISPQFLEFFKLSYQDSKISQVIDTNLKKWFANQIADNQSIEILNSDRIIVTHVVIPDLIGKKNPYLGIEVQYKYTLPIPFFHRTITLSKRAYERIWVGS